jgi:hypothetical protein
MVRYLLQHRHQPRECGVVFASFTNHEGPLRHRATVASCRSGRHAIGWSVEAASEELALRLLPAYVAARTTVSMPIWYWAIADPDGQYGLTNSGPFTVETLGEAAAMTAIGLTLARAALLLARGCAMAHAGLAARILTPESAHESAK